MNRKLRDTVLIIATIITVMSVIIGNFITVNSECKILEKPFFGGGHHDVEQTIDGDIREIKLDMDIADVVIEKGDENSVSFSSSRTNNPKYEFKDGVLSIVASKNIKISPFNKNASDVVIKVKNDVENIDIQLDVGSLAIKNIAVKNYSSLVNMGDIEISNSKIENITVNGDLGDIDIDDVDFLTGEVKSSAGDVNIELPFDDKEYSLDVKVDFGEVTVGGHKAGNQFQTFDGMRTLKVTLDMGDLDIRY